MVLVGCGKWWQFLIHHLVSAFSTDDVIIILIITIYSSFSLSFSVPLWKSYIFHVRSAFHRLHAQVSNELQTLLSQTHTIELNVFYKKNSRKLLSSSLQTYTSNFVESQLLNKFNFQLTFCRL